MLQLDEVFTNSARNTEIENANLKVANEIRKMQQVHL